MTADEIRRMQVNSRSETLQIEVAAQIAELNANFKEFFAYVKNLVPTKEEQNKVELKKVERTQLATK